MLPRKTFLAALLLSSAFSATAGASYEIRFLSKGVKAPGVETPAPQLPPPPPQVSLSLNEWDFGTVAFDTPAVKSFTLANIGVTPAEISFGTLSAPFSLDAGNCAGALLKQESCEFTVIHRGLVPDESNTADLVISLGDGAEPVTASLRSTTASRPGSFATGVANAIYSNGGATVARTPGTTLEVGFANAKATGKWYYEMQSTAQGTLLFKNSSGSGYYLDFSSRIKHTTGTGVDTSDLGPQMTTSSTARYGFALNADSRIMYIYDVTKCSIVSVVWWSSPGAVRPQIGFRPSDAASSAITAYFAPAGKTCIPDGHRWWNGD